MAWINSEEEVDKIIEDLKSKNKKYITKGVSFDKNNEAHMRLLKYCLMHSDSFSAIVKELIASRVNETPVNNKVDITTTPNTNVNTVINKPEVAYIPQQTKDESDDLNNKKEVNISNFL